MFMDTESKNIETAQPDEEITAPEPEHTLPLPDPDDKAPSRFTRLKTWYLKRKKLTVPATALLFIAVIAGIPYTRYAAAGVVMKQDFALRVIDSTTGSPVSDAAVSAGSITAMTDGDGRAVLKGLPVGTRSITVAKKHYKDSRSSFLVPIFDQKTAPSIKLDATGRLVTVRVVNYVNQKPLAKVSIKVSDIEATSDKDGQALLVLPAGAATQSASLQLEGYLTSNVEVAVTGRPDETLNTFSLVPSGQVYFMSKRTGKLDLMKANIDGTDAKVVLAGTGHEQDYRTSMVPSPNLEYVALQTRRSPADQTPQLYIVSSEGSIRALDGGSNEFYVHGWSGSNLIYTVTNNNAANWQTGKHKLKSYDTASEKVMMLDQSAGTDEVNNAGESYGLVAVYGSLVTYAKNWVGYHYGTDLSGKQHSLHTISSTGQNHKLVSTYEAEKYSHIQYRQRSPNSFYFYLYGEGQQDSYFEYVTGSQPKQADLDQEKFYESFPSHVLSPNGQKTVWSDVRDGKDVILIGDSGGNNSSSIASLEEYAVYGWMGNDYILISKKNSELYIMDTSGSAPVKITDYHSVNSTYRYY